MRTGVWITRLAVLIAGGFLLAACHQNGTVFAVDVTTDSVDANPGDGICADAAGHCSVRAAVMEANALPGVEEISLPAGVVHTLSIVGDDDTAAAGDLDILEQVVITGGTISAGQTVERVLDLHHPSGIVELDTVELSSGLAVDGALIRHEAPGILGIVRSHFWLVAGTEGSQVHLDGGPTWILDSTFRHLGASAPLIRLESGSATLSQVTMDYKGTLDPTAIENAGGALTIDHLSHYSPDRDNTPIHTIAGTTTITRSAIDRGTCAGAITSLGYNVAPASCAGGGPGDSNAGTTWWSISGMSSSPGLPPTYGAVGSTVDHIPLAACKVGGQDARGNPRGVGNGCDAGAVERQVTSTTCDPAAAAPGVDFSFCDLSGVNFISDDLTGADFTGADLTNALLANATLDDAVFHGAILDHANLQNARVDDATFFGGSRWRLRAVNLVGEPTGAEHWVDVGAVVDGAFLGPGADVSGYSTPNAAVVDVIDGADLSSSSWGRLEVHVSAVGADFTDADLPGFRGYGDLSDTDFTGATLNAEFFIRDADLSGSIWTNVTTGRGVLLRTDVDGAVFDTANWTKPIGISLTGTLTSPHPDIHHLGPLMLGSGPEFYKKVIVNGLDLSGLALPWTLSEIQAIGTDFTGSTLGPVIAGDFTGADFTRTGFASIDGAVLDGAVLTAPDLLDVEVRDTSAVGSTSTNGYFADPPTLYGPWLRSWSATPAGLDSSTLTGIDLTGARLRGADFTGSDLSGADLRGLRTDYLLPGGSADVSFADLTGVRLDDSDAAGWTYNFTTCPDGTLSQDNGGTCAGILPIDVWEIVQDPTGSGAPLSQGAFPLGTGVVKPTLEFVQGATIVEGTSAGVDWYIDGVLFRDDDHFAPFELGAFAEMPTGAVFNGQGAGAGNSFLLTGGAHTITAVAETTAGTITFRATFRVDAP